MSMSLDSSKLRYWNSLVIGSSGYGERAARGTTVTMLTTVVVLVELGFGRPLVRLTTRPSKKIEVVLFMVEVLAAGQSKSTDMGWWL